MDVEKIYSFLREDFKNYIKESHLQSVVLGISGGIDSAIIAALFSDVCKECNVNFIGRSISIESNKQDEKDRADAIGKSLCHDYKHVDLSYLYDVMCKCGIDEFDRNESMREHYNINLQKIRLGNIKARMRMMYLYNVAQHECGMVLDTDNKTEHNLGFWTLHGDVGDYSPLIDLWKTEVYALSNYTVSQLKSPEAKAALQACIDATPTDGLGITSSDVEQLGCSNYAEVDVILKECVEYRNETCDDGENVNLANSEQMAHVRDNKVFENCSDEEYTEKFNKIYKRHINSDFKRNNPYHVSL